MNRHLLFATLTGILLFSACSKDTDFATETTDDIIHLSADITPLEGTRAETDENGIGRFTTGDEISLLISADNAAATQAHTMTLDPNGWQPELHWNQINGRNITFSAFHPTLGTTDEAIFTHNVAQNQSAEADYLRSDLLHALKTVAQKQEVHLAFRHLMSRLCITLTSDGSFTDEELSQATLSVNAYAGIEVNTSDGSLGRTSGTAEKITPHRKGNRHYALLCPQKIADSWKSDSWVEITIGGKSISYKAPATLADGTPFEALESGKQIQLNITVKKKQEETDWRGKTAWVYGVEPPAVETWGYTSPTPPMERALKWTPGCHWFDCNKIAPNDAQNIDSKMCWAAAASNSLYWWLEQNRAYVERYGKYTGPSRYSSLDSEIFKLYRLKFGNTGADVAAALDWFITGRFGMNQLEGAGFFQEVFGTGHVARITRFSEKTLGQELQYAFTHQEAVECTYAYPRGTLTHAVSIWGADFDETGEVCAIYITDNNDRDLDEQNEFIDWQGRPITQAGIIRKRVRKESNGTFYMEGSSEGIFNFRIIELNLIGLMQDRWEEYFSRLQ